SSARVKTIYGTPEIPLLLVRLCSPALRRCRSTAVTVVTASCNPLHSQAARTGGSSLSTSRAANAAANREQENVESDPRHFSPRRHRDGHRPAGRRRWQVPPA